MHLGIDLGGSKTEIIALTSDSQELWRKRIPSPRGDYSKTLDTLCQLVQEAEQKLQIKATVGLGIPGALSPESGRVKNATSTWLIGHPLQQDLSRLLKRPIVIANDADCFTLSEASDGAAKSFQNVFGVILGTGVGGGIVINKQLVSGPNAISGEWGHNPLPSCDAVKDGLTHCYCGKQNCIETYLSGPGLVARYLEKTSHHDVGLEAVEYIARMRDRSHPEHASTTQYFKQFTDQLARALALVINIIDPDIIVFGGGLSNIDEIYQSLPNALIPYVFSDTIRTHITKAQHGDSSGVRGAAWLGAKASR